MYPRTRQDIDFRWSSINNKAHANSDSVPIMIHECMGFDSDKTRVNRVGLKGMSREGAYSHQPNPDTQIRTLRDPEQGWIVRNRQKRCMANWLRTDLQLEDVHSHTHLENTHSKVCVSTPAYMDPFICTHVHIHRSTINEINTHRHRVFVIRWGGPEKGIVCEHRDPHQQKLWKNQVLQLADTYLHTKIFSSLRKGSTQLDRHPSRSLSILFFTWVNGFSFSYVIDYLRT